MLVSHTFLASSSTFCEISARCFTTWKPGNRYRDLMDLVLGTAQLTRPYGALANWRVPSGVSDTQDLVLSAEKWDFRGIDTAPAYGDAEASIGAAGTSLPIHTKFDPDLSEVESVRESLLRLRRKSIDIAYFHRPMASRQAIRMVPKIRNSLSRELVHKLGASIYDLRELPFLLDCEHITAIQCPFSVFDRRFSRELLADFVARGGQVYVRSVFLQGLLLVGSERVPEGHKELAPFLETFWEACREWEVSPVSAAIQFAHQSLPFAGLIVGTSRVEELEQIARASKVKVDRGFMDTLNEMKLPARHVVDPRQW